MQQQCFHNQEITRIYLQPDSQAVQLLCEECIEDKGLTTKFDQLVLLQKVKKQPEELLSKINLDNTVKVFLSKLLKATEDDLKNTKRKWNDRLQTIKQILDKLINETETYFDQLKKELEDFRRGLVTIVNFSRFEQLIQDDQQANKEIQIVNYIKELESGVTGQKKTDILNLINVYKEKIKNTQIPSITDRLSFITQEMNDYQTTVNKYSQKCNPDIHPQLPQFPIQQSSKILSQRNFEKLLERITNQKRYTINLIYQAQQLGINSESFWNSVNNKSNLLMIFKSKNKAIFGGYTPCQWKKLSTPLQQGIYDDNSISFLFCQNGEDLKFFPIKRENKPAIILNSSQGPNFGGDLNINADFQGGTINLGTTYSNDIQPGQPQLVFGSQNQPNINECEIIQILHQ
ncbi:unnamed protein product [Paramecium octaurelia]|uniref:TLDc domain-containing protein n=1 Tax=Paramecium octaurelia TaxID=43137 RepID=A0A8S1WWS5_PAROT|nr:unnamed protein product [Paramecium octaurelia]